MPRKLQRKPQNTNGSKRPHPQEPPEDLLSARQEESSPAALMAARPEIYQKCVDYLESGMSPGGVSALCHVSIGLARKIRNTLGPEALHSAIRETGRNMIEASQLMSERLVKETHKLPLTQIPQSLAMMVDKSLLISGAPTARVEHTRVPTQEELIRMFERLPKTKVTDLTPPSSPPDITPSAPDKLLPPQ